MEAVPPLQATDGLSHAYEYEVGARRKVAAALARATRPFAVLGAVVARDLDLVEMCLHAAAVDAPGQPPAFSFWVAHAHATLRALVLGCPERQTNRTVIVHSDDTSIELRMRWTEDAVHAPLPASRWAAALGIACLAEDEELLAALVEPGWQERLRRHEQEVSVPAHHRLLLAAALASLVRGDAMPDLAQVRDALERDIAGPRPGPEGLIRDPSALRRDVEPLLAAIEMFATRDADEAATRAAWDAYVASVRAAPPTVLYALARVAARRGIAGALPSWAPCFAVADRRAPPTVEELEPLPPTSARDARDLARVPTSLGRASGGEEVGNGRMAA